MRMINGVPHRAIVIFISEPVRKAIRDIAWRRDCKYSEVAREALELYVAMTPLQPKPASPNDPPGDPSVPDPAGPEQ